MKKLLKSKQYIFSLLFFVITIVLNYMSANGVLFSHSQKEISDMYQNLLAPSGMTFSIWGLIYIGMLVGYIFPAFRDMKKEDETFYLKKVIPYYTLWASFNIAWTITWNNDRILLSLPCIILYAVALVKLISVLDKNKYFERKYRWLVTFPVGLHAGWLIFASFTNIMVLMVKYGFDAFSTLGVVMTILFMILAVLCVVAVYRRYDNFTITIPAVWALFGIFMKQRPSSDFQNSSSIVMWSAIALIVIALVIHGMILQAHRKRR